VGRLPTILLAVLALLLAVPAIADAASYPTVAPTETRLLALVNDVRAEHGLDPLRASRGLRTAAREHSAAMLDGDFFDHGRGWERRVRRHVSAEAVAEALAWGSGTWARPAKLVSMWMHSPPHRRILLDATLRRVGFGALRGTFQGSDGAIVVTADFAT
jgi:uncharacterized protein YkwD